VGVPASIGLGLGAIFALHVLAPNASVTWSYAHLDRAAAFPWLAWIGVVVLPPLGGFLFARWAAADASPPASVKPSSSLSPLARLVRIAIALAFVFVWTELGLRWSTPWLSPDSNALQTMVEQPGAEIARWHLLLPVYQAVARGLDAVSSTHEVIVLLSGVFGGLALVAIVVTAELVSRSRAMAIGVASLVVTSFGVAQVALGYNDVYPVPLFGVALYLLLAVRAMAGRGSPAWAIAWAGVAPFVYLGLVLIVPSAGVLAFDHWRRERSLRPLVIGAAAAVVLAGLATIPRFGVPFAWSGFLAAQVELPSASMGYNASGYTLPLAQVLSAGHLWQVLHGVLLVDPVGSWLTLTLAIPVAARVLAAAPSLAVRVAALVGAIVLPYGVFLLWMDPLYGAYVDWDLFSYGAVATSLLGALLLFEWGRARPQWLGVLLGLAVAVNATHLLARFHGLPIDRAEHLQESPEHLRVPAERTGDAQTPGWRSMAGNASIESIQGGALWYQTRIAGVSSARWSIVPTRRLTSPSSSASGIP